MARKQTQNPKPMNLGEFIISKVRKLESKNGVALGTTTEGVWQEVEPGEYWDTIRTGNMFENPTFITLDELVREHKFHVEMFENRMMEIGVW